MIDEGPDKYLGQMVYVRYKVGNDGKDRISLLRSNREENLSIYSDKFIYYRKDISISHTSGLMVKHYNSSTVNEPLGLNHPNIDMGMHRFISTLVRSREGIETPTEYSGMFNHYSDYKDKVLEDYQYTLLCKKNTYDSNNIQLYCKSEDAEYKVIYDDSNNIKYIRVYVGGKNLVRIGRLSRTSKSVRIGKKFEYNVNINRAIRTLSFLDDRIESFVDNTFKELNINV